MIYLIKPVGKRGPVKIGVANNPEDRLAGLQCGSPLQLEIVGLISGDYALERALHHRLRDDRLHGEWFRWSPELAQLIRENAFGPIRTGPVPRLRPPAASPDYRAKQVHAKALELIPYSFRMESA
jgi:Meiotically up-regulated gene 113